MDINSNNQNDNKKTILGKNKNILPASLIATLIILIFAVISVASYLPIRNIYFPIKDNTKNYIESTDFARTLTHLTVNLKRYIEQNDSWYDDNYINVESVKYKVIYSNADNLNDDINNKTEQNIDEVENQNYTVEHMEQQTTPEEQQFNILSNMANNIKTSAIEKDMENSLFYLHAKFDEGGNLTIESTPEVKFKSETFVRSFNNFSDEFKEDYADLDILYIVPSDFENYEDDIIAYKMKSYYVFSDYSILILIIGAISILMLIIVSFAVPYEKQAKMAICKVFNKMFLELKFFVWGGVVILCIAIINTLNNSDYYYNSLKAAIYDANCYFYMIGIPITFILYFFIFLSIIYIKNIYNIGFKKGVIENSICGKIYLKIYRKIVLIVKKLTQIDLKKDNYKKLVALVGVNLAVILILDSSNFLGFVFAITYSSFIFRYSLKLLEKAKVLNEASSQVAKGNFDIKVDEHMGILSPMAKNLNNIKQGFSLAIDKEIKSERMKTQLISNVSHDLRTPLTSIITYIDLLKDEHISKEEREKYINILDKKSQRLKILIEDLFDASKAHSGNIDFELDDLDIVALFRQTMGELEEKISESTLQIKMNVPENKIICNLDGRRTYRVFENIMTNILKYSMPNTRVYVDIEEEETDVILTFRNISAYEMNFDASEITERFSRGDESRNTEGSGLGLSIAKSLVELQNGTLEIIIDGDLFKLIVTFPKVS